MAICYLRNSGDRDVASKAIDTTWGQRLLPNGLLAAASGVLVLATFAAIARGRADWGQVSPLVWLHLASIMLATSLTPVLLVRSWLFG